MYQHKEAFALMYYECETCHRREVIWNSRDGVTPFTIQCGRSGCRGVASHVDWHLDTRRKNHVFFNGQRYFADMTEERSLLLARAALERRPDLEFSDERVAQIARSYFGSGHEPDVLTWFVVNNTKAASTV